MIRKLIQKRNHFLSRCGERTVPITRATLCLTSFLESTGHTRDVQRTRRRHGGPCRFVPLRIAAHDGHRSEFYRRCVSRRSHIRRLRFGSRENTCEFPECIVLFKTFNVLAAHVAIQAVRPDKEKLCERPDRVVTLGARCYRCPRALLWCM